MVELADTSDLESLSIWSTSSSLVMGILCRWKWKTHYTLNLALIGSIQIRKVLNNLKNINISIDNSEYIYYNRYTSKDG